MRAIEGLHLALFVDTQHDRAVRRIQIQAHDIADLVDKQRIGRELKGFRQMRLETESAPDSRDRGLAQTGRFRQTARAPVRRVLRLRFQRAGDDILDLCVRDGARSAGAWFVEETVQPLPHKASPPLAHRLQCDAELLRHRGVRSALGTGQDDPRAQRKMLTGLRPPHPARQHFPLLIRHTHTTALGRPVLAITFLLCRHIIMSDRRAQYLICEFLPHHTSVELPFRRVRNSVKTTGG